MKIYEIATGYTPIPAQIGAATEIVVEALTRAFRNRGIPAEIIDIRSANRPATDLPIRQVPIPSFLSGADLKLGLMHKLKRVIYSCSLARTLKTLLRQEEERPVLHFHNQYNLFFFLLLTAPHLRRKALIAYTVHSGIWRQDWREIRHTVRRRYFQERFCMKHCDLLFVLNRETEETALTHLNVPPRRIVRTCNGIDPLIYRPLGKNHTMLVLQVGSVCENKGQLRSARLLLPLLQKYPELNFCYAGGIVEEAYQDAILTFAQKYGLEDQIRYLGMIPPGKLLNELYNRAVFTLFPSAFEAFGLAAVESLAAGTPVLIPEDSPLDFGCGCICYREDSFAEIAKKLLVQDNSSLRTATSSHAVRAYCWDKAANDHLAAFKERMHTT